MANFTMITRHGVEKGQATHYTLINEAYQTVTVSAADVANFLANKTHNIYNLALGEGGKIVSTNGALDKYTFINNANNQVVGTARAVILDRVEHGDKLIGYTVFTQNAQIREMSVAEAATLASKNLISNGKIRHTKDGDIVSAIGGNFPLRTIKIEQAPRGELKVTLMFFTEAFGAKHTTYVGAIISNNSAVDMNKISEKLTEDNAKVKAKVAAISGNKDTASLNIQRFGANGLYGVFSLEVIEKLIGKAKVSYNNNRVLVTAMDHKADAEETVLVIGTDNKEITVNNKGTDAGLAKAKALADKVVTLIK